jgi:type VI secretion system secreted protein Hcp
MLKTKLAALTVAAGTALAIAPSAHAATDYFMRIDPVQGQPQIQGESQDAAFPGSKGYIEIKSFDYSVENPTTIGSATSGAGAGKAKFNDLEIEKNVDQTSPQVFQALAAGQHYNGVEIVARKAGQTTATPIVNRYYFSLAVPTSDEQSGDAGDETTQEKLTFAYGGLALKYVPQTATGAAKAAVLAKWSVLTNSTNWIDPMAPLPGEMTTTSA